jgi:hypothetical protein
VTLSEIETELMGLRQHEEARRRHWLSARKSEMFLGVMLAGAGTFFAVAGLVLYVKDLTAPAYVALGFAVTLIFASLPLSLLRVAFTDPAPARSALDPSLIIARVRAWRALTALGRPVSGSRVSPHWPRRDVLRPASDT